MALYIAALTVLHLCERKVKAETLKDLVYNSLLNFSCVHHFHEFQSIGIVIRTVRYVLNHRGERLGLGKAYFFQRSLKHVYLQDTVISNSVYVLYRLFLSVFHAELYVVNVDVVWYCLDDHLLVQNHGQRLLVLRYLCLVRNKLLASELALDH